MAIDPVCMMQVEPANVTVKAWYRGKVYYFCSTYCEKAFAADPRKYASGAPAGGTVVSRRSGIYNEIPAGRGRGRNPSRHSGVPVETRYTVQGMKCGGCIAKATEALAKLPGYEGAEFDLTSGTAVVKGAVDAQAVVRALAGAGYPAARAGG